MKGAFALRVLETIGDAAVSTADILEILLTSSPGTAFRGFERKLSRLERERERRRLKNEEVARARERYQNVLLWLRREGLIREAQGKGAGMVFVTPAGVRKLHILKARSAVPQVVYKRESAERFTIVMFDIPERERHKRVWLRSALRALGFRMLQKSVWGGKVKIPKTFLDDLAKLRLLGFVEIFEITKAGSLRHVA